MSNTKATSARFICDEPAVEEPSLGGFIRSVLDSWVLGGFGVGVALGFVAIVAAEALV